METLLYIRESEVRDLLNFDDVYEAVEVALESVTKNCAVQNARGITLIPNSSNRIYTMPCYLQSEKYESLGCKILAEFYGGVHDGSSSIKANVLLIDEKYGHLKAIIAATEITLWRTAAASAVATAYLHRQKDRKVLAIIGAGEQGKIHALAFQHHFAFKEVRIWNRTFEKAKNLVRELNQEKNKVFVACETVKDCVYNADVIVTATASNGEPLVRYEYIKKGVHINVIGGQDGKFEVDQTTYDASDVYIDSWEGAKSELGPLKVEFKGQIGDVITGIIQPRSESAMTIFHSLGMAVEDCAVARLVYDLYKQRTVSG